MAFNTAGNLSYGSLVCLHQQQSIGYDGNGIAVVDSTGTYNVQGCITWVTFGTALNNYSVASQTDLSSAINPTSIQASMSSVLSNYVLKTDFNALAASVGVQSEAFDPVVAGEFFSFSFVGVLTCWLVSHLASSVLRPIRR